MRAALPLLALLLARPSWAETASGRQAPAYTSSSIVNAASQAPGQLAPNTIATLYGAELAFVTRALRPEDIRDQQMPTVLPNTGLRVLVSNIPAPVFFVSPGQVNFLVPGNLVPGETRLQLTLDGRAGPEVAVRLAAAAPALFVTEDKRAIALRPDGSLVSPADPARPGDVVSLYATGLGPVRPPLRPGEIARQAAPLEWMERFQVSVDGEPVDAANLLYAGVAPGFAGLYQIDVRLPEPAGADPVLKIRLDGIESPEAALSLQRTTPGAASLN